MNTLMQKRSIRGFSLIEVLAAMAVLSLIVLMISKMFVDTNAAWQIGTRKVDQDTQGRTALEWMTRELATAMADGVLTLRTGPGRVDFYGQASTLITFTTLNHRPEYRSGNPYREVQQVRYYLYGITNIFTLARHVTENESSGSFSCYTTPNWTTVFDVAPYAGQDQWANVLAEHVAKFDVTVYITNGSGVIAKANYDSAVDPPPAWIDLTVYMLNADDAEKAAVMKNTGRDPSGLLDRTAKRYVARAYPHNVQGNHVYY